MNLLSKYGLTVALLLAAACTLPTSELPPVVIAAPGQNREDIAKNRFFNYNKSSEGKHKRCGMCHVNVEKGILHDFIETKTERINPTTNKPYDRIEAICTSCHNQLHIAHPVGIVPNPKRAQLPPEALGFKGEENNLTCMGCHDWHPTNQSYKYLRWPTKDASELASFCTHCHSKQSSDIQLVSSYKSMSEGKKPSQFADATPDIYLKESGSEKTTYHASRQGAMVNLQNFNEKVEDRKKEAPPPAVKVQMRPAQQRLEAALQKTSAPPQPAASNSTAEDQLKQRLEEAPQDYKAYFRLAELYKSQSSWNNAIFNYRKTIELNPKFVRADYELGDIYLKKGQLSEATESFEEAVKQDANYAMAYYGLGRVLHAQGKTQEAIREYEKAVELDPNGSEVYYGLGLIYKNTQPDKAMELFQQAVHNDSGNSGAYYEMGLIYKAKDNMSQAKEMFENARATSTQNARASYELGLLYRLEGKYARSLQMLEEAAANQIDEPQVYYELGRLYQDKEEIDKAISMYSKAAQLKSDYAEAYYQLATIFRQHRQFPDAVEMLTKACKLNPQFYQGYLTLGYVYEEQKNPAGAEEAYRKAVSLKSDYAEANLALGKLLLSQKKLDQAVDLLKKAVQQSPDEPQGYYQLSQAFRAQGKPDEFQWAYQKAITLQISHMKSGGKKELSANMTTSEVDSFLAATQLDPRNPEAHYNLGTAYMAAGDYSKATASLITALNYRSRYKEAQYALGLALKAAGNLDQAAQAFQTGLQWEPDNHDIRYSLAETHRAMGDLDKAIAEYESLLKSKSHNVSYILGLVYYERWNKLHQAADISQADRYLNDGVRQGEKSAEAAEIISTIKQLLSRKIQVLLIQSRRQNRIKLLSQSLRPQMSFQELSQFARQNPEESKILFTTPQDLGQPLGPTLQQLSNGQASEIVDNNNEYYIIYRITSL